MYVLRSRISIHKGLVSMYRRIRIYEGLAYIKDLFQSAHIKDKYVCVCRIIICKGFVSTS